MKQLLSPLKKARGLGSLKKGGHDWLMGRLYMLAFVLLAAWFVSFVFCYAGADYATWIAALQKTHNMAFMVLFLYVLCQHFHHEIQVVIEDYVKPGVGRVLSLLLLRAFFVILGLIGMLALIRIYVS